MVIIDCEQYEPEWWDARLGIPTASKFDQIITTKGEPSKSSKKYLNQLAIEQITGAYAGSEYASSSMKRGHKYEPEARNLFSMIYDIDVQQAGLIFRDEQRKYAASPDGLLEDSGLEIYCPESDNAVECFLHPDKAIGIAKKFQQIQGSLLVSGFEYWWFETYYPGMTPLIFKVSRDEDFIGKLEAELDRFTIELASVVKTLKGMS